MIIAIASDDGMHVAEDPGQCSGFVVFEVGPSGTVRVGYRSACTQNGDEYGVSRRLSSAPAGPYEPLVAALSDCGAMIARNMDEALLRELQGSVIEAYVCRDGNVDQAAQLFMQGGLRKLTSRGCRQNQ